MSNSGKRYTAEQIIHILREIDVLTSNGHSLQMACKQAGISEQSYYRWRKMYGGMKSERWPRAVGQFLGIYKWVLRG